MAFFRIIPTVVGILTTYVGTSGIVVVVLLGADWPPSAAIFIRDALAYIYFEAFILRRGRSSGFSSFFSKTDVGIFFSFGAGF